MKADVPNPKAGLRAVAGQTMTESCSSPTRARSRCGARPRPGLREYRLPVDFIYPGRGRSADPARPGLPGRQGVGQIHWHRIHQDADLGAGADELRRARDGQRPGQHQGRRQHAGAAHGAGRRARQLVIQPDWDAINAQRDGPSAGTARSRPGVASHVRHPIFASRHGETVERREACPGAAFFDLPRPRRAVRSQAPWPSLAARLQLEGAIYAVRGRSCMRPRYDGATVPGPAQRGPPWARRRAARRAGLRPSAARDELGEWDGWSFPRSRPLAWRPCGAVGRITELRRPAGESYAMVVVERPAGVDDTWRWREQPVAVFAHGGVGRVLRARSSAPPGRDP